MYRFHLAWIFHPYYLLTLPFFLFDFFSVPVKFPLILVELYRISSTGNLNFQEMWSIWIYNKILIILFLNHWIFFCVTHFCDTFYESIKNQRWKLRKRRGRRKNLNLIWIMYMICECEYLRACVYACMRSALYFSF